MLVALAISKGCYHGKHGVVQFRWQALASSSQTYYSFFHLPSALFLVWHAILRPARSLWVTRLGTTLRHAFSKNWVAVVGWLQHMALWFLLSIIAFEWHQPWALLVVWWDLIFLLGNIVISLPALVLQAMGRDLRCSLA